MNPENENFDGAWNDIKSVFGLESRPRSSSDHLSSSTIQFLKSEHLAQGILEYLQAEVELRLRRDVVPAFWNHFEKTENLSEVEKAAIFQKVNLANMWVFYKFDRNYT